MVLFSHEQNIICGQTQLDDIVHLQTIICRQLFVGQKAGSRPMKVVFDSPGLLNVAIWLVSSVLDLPNGQVKCFEKFNIQKNCEINSAHQKIWGAS